MRNIKLTIEFEGTDYCGWQKQPNGISVQETMEKSIEKITKEPCKLTSSGRTDSGVHALGMVANFKTKSSIEAERFSYAINSVLPRNIVIKDSREVNFDFHARFKAKGKKYRYLIYNAKFPSALWRNRTCHIKYNLNLEKMNHAKNYFLGEHNFRAFTSSNTDTKSYVRIVEDIDIFKKDDFITIEITGNGFLYNMVRIIAGTLIDVGMNKIEPDFIEKIIKNKNRKLAGKTMPPQGLYLVEVYY
jgi:tRNA pseudouridine38-40 synthase